MQPYGRRATRNVGRRLTLGPRSFERSGGVVCVLHRGDLEIRIGEGCVRETEAELEARLDVILR